MYNPESDIPPNPAAWASELHQPLAGDPCLAVAHENTAAGAHASDNKDEKSIAPIAAATTSLDRPKAQ